MSSRKPKATQPVPAQETVPITTPPATGDAIGAIEVVEPEKLYDNPWSCFSVEGAIKALPSHPDKLPQVAALAIVYVLRYGRGLGLGKEAQKVLTSMSPPDNGRPNAKEKESVEKPETEAGEETEEANGPQSAE